eukprot:NODE_4876_length_303_cov_546.996063_g4794_i0.p2 GENE.NODE_4876_length_303_cov_546.996063_g4794_i0~~NODE_4876_length_303_cov_546.996063_g4794_i0.p2  ORF type:complete len:57 (+),score=2.85 NODE_4876_length_303_cov_546.996063_g4794_i0:28-171(+)
MGATYYAIVLLYYAILYCTTLYTKLYYNALYYRLCCAIPSLFEHEYN